MHRLDDDAIRTAGDRALLICLPDLAASLVVRAQLQGSPLAGQRDLVTGARTVLVTFDSAGLLGTARDSLLDRIFGRATGRPPAVGTIEIPVIYDGADLADVGRLTGLGADGVIAAHVASAWTVAFSGFAPGFGYLTGGDPRLTVQRRESSRPSVPAGSVGLAGEFSGIYPRASPGGWQLIGHTNAAMWQIHRDPPALLTPGRRVRFEPVDRLPVADPEAPPRPGEADHPGTSGPERYLTIVRPGILSTVQDLGRPGYADLGVSASGAADQISAAAANRAVGNAPGAAVLEITLGGLTFRGHGDLVVAVAGAEVPITLAGSLRSISGGAVTVPDGVEVSLGKPVSGLRSYLAIDGGIEVPPVLGSRSADLLSGLGPPALRRGDQVPVGAAPGGPVEIQPGRPADVEPDGPPPAPPRARSAKSAAPAVLEVTVGPRSDWFTAEARGRLTSALYTVTPQSNRVGLRLAGPTLARSAPGELPSEGMVTGAVQIPPSGEPVVFLADHPVTGGYPVIAVLTDASIGLAAQLRPGAQLRFRLR